LIEALAELRRLRKVRVPAIRLALVAIPRRVICKMIGLKLDVAREQPAPRLREPGPEHLRGELAMVRIAEAFRQVVKEREHDELIIAPRLEDPRRRLQAMPMDVERCAERIGVLECGHEGEQTLAGQAFAKLALGAVHDLPIRGARLGECMKVSAFQV